MRGEPEFQPVSRGEKIDTREERKMKKGLMTNQEQYDSLFLSISFRPDAI